jgi:hypothetical protein
MAKTMGAKWAAADEYFVRPPIGVVDTHADSFVEWLLSAREAERPPVDVRYL